MSRSLMQRISIVIALAVVLALGLAFVPVIASAVAPDPVSTAWKHSRDAGSYAFTSDVQIVTTPSGSVINAGRRGRSDTLHLEGATNMREQTLAADVVVRWRG